VIWVNNDCIIDAYLVSIRIKPIYTVSKLPYYM
jgi:hypothetical protein